VRSIPWIGRVRGGPAGNFRREKFSLICDNPPLFRLINPYC
jgi:hypothetical protein